MPRACSARRPARPRSGPRAATASTARIALKKLAPEPPYASGISMPMTPELEQRRQSSGSSAPATSIAATCGRLRASGAKPNTVSKNSVRRRKAHQGHACRRVSRDRVARVPNPGARCRRAVMAGNSFGQAFRITTAGESHGPGNVVIIDGCPSGIPLSAEDDLAVDLARRRPGQSHLVTQRHEADSPEILAGVFEGRTTGTSIADPGPQHRSEEPGLRGHQGQVPPRPRRLHLRRQVRLPRLSRRRAARAPARPWRASAAGVVAKKMLALSVRRAT